MISEILLASLPYQSNHTSFGSTILYDHGLWLRHHHLMVSSPWSYLQACNVYWIYTQLDQFCDWLYLCYIVICLLNVHSCVVCVIVLSRTCMKTYFCVCQIICLSIAYVCWGCVCMCMWLNVVSLGCHCLAIHREERDVFDYKRMTLDVLPNFLQLLPKITIQRAGANAP